MEEQNKKYLIIGIVIIVVAIIAAVTIISTSSNGDGGMNLNIASGAVEITNVDQSATFYEDTESGNSHYSYEITFSLSDINPDANYSAKAVWYDMNGSKVLTSSENIDYDIYTLEGDTIDYMSLSTQSSQLLNISKCTIEIFCGNTIVGNYTYEWVNSPITKYSF